MTDKIYAPWTLEQVDALNRFQTSGHTRRPFTCGREHDIPVVLIARTDGWHCSDPACGYRQNWAPAIFAEPPSEWPAWLAAAKKTLREAEERQRAEAAATERDQQQEQAAPVDWQAIAKQRETELKEVGEARHRAETELARLREGEEDSYDPRTVPTPGQWIHQFNQAPAAKRLEVVAATIEAAERGHNCFLMGHEKRLAAAEAAVAELAQAIRLTREYVGEELLPPIEGWSWYDALRRHAPHELPALDGPGPEETDTTEAGEELVHVGWYCWRCHAINAQACRSDNVPIHVPAEWTREMEAEIARREEEDEDRDAAPVSRAGEDDAGAYAQAVARVESSGPRTPIRQHPDELREQAETDMLDTRPDLEDTCRPVDIDGETIRVRGAADMSDEARAALADVIRAAKRKYAAEHPEQPAESLLERRLRLAHQARRAKEQQLDGIRRALCDVGAMHDDDPYAHADLEDVIRPAFQPHAPVPAPAATEATSTPDTITDPEWLRQQYTAVIRCWWDADDGGAEEIAAAVLNVRDRHVQQLRQRLALAAELAGTVQAAKQRYAAEQDKPADGEVSVLEQLGYHAMGQALDLERVQAERDQLARTLAVVLGEFRILPGTHTATAHIETETIDRWRATLDQTQEQS